MASIKRRAGRIRVQLRPEERMVLTGFSREVAQLLGGAPPPDPDPLVAMVGIASPPAETPPQTPDDPALLRLLPDAYDDPAGAAEFRRLTDDELRRGKASALTQLAADVDGAEELDLEVEEADLWAQALNDIRLVLGVRLGIDDDHGRWRASLSPDDPRMPLLAAYDWLTGLQELLLDAIVRG